MCKKKQIEKAIPADEVIQALKCCASEEDNCHRCPFMGVGGISDICITAMSRAALDLIYRKQSEGEWRPYKTPLDARQTGWICSNCSSVVYDLSNGDTDFCPYCGAKMKGGE